MNALRSFGRTYAYQTQVAASLILGFGSTSLPIEPNIIYRLTSKRVAVIHVEFDMNSPVRDYLNLNIGGFAIMDLSEVVPNGYLATVQYSRLIMWPLCSPLWPKATAKAFLTPSTLFGLWSQAGRRSWKECRRRFPSSGCSLIVW